MKRYSLILCMVLIVSLSGVASAQIVLGPPPAAAGGVVSNKLIIGGTTVTSTYNIFPYPVVGGYIYTGTTGGILNTINNNVLTISATSDNIYNSIERVLGLSQQNYRLFNQVYDANNCLLASSIKIYKTANDCNIDTNPISEYSMIATYNATGQMEEYKVIEI